MRVGEIDLIARDPGAGEPCELVFVEVRMRNSRRHGSGADTVGPRKQLRLRRAARAYLVQQVPPGAPEPLCRFDVISLRRSNAADRPRWQIQWIRDAFY